MKNLVLAILFVPSSQDWTPLFPEEGVPKGWIVRKWDDISKPSAEGAVWKVEGGVLLGSDPRGTWLVSEKEYGDFILEFEWKLGERGNSGCGLRFPLKGDPAYLGLEIQMIDPRYFGERKVRPEELSASIYSAVAPSKQVYKPDDWNKYAITCKGAQVTVVFNGEKVLDVNVDEHAKAPKWKDGTDGLPLKDRPRKGRIGFQELSRTGRVEIRNARLKVLE